MKAQEGEIAGSVAIDRYIDRYSLETLRNRSQRCGTLNMETTEP